MHLVLIILSYFFLVHCFDQVNTKHSILMDYLYSLHSIIRVIHYSIEIVFSSTSK